jgi:CubicO group peptidase (beta-lactamase class C family)
MLGNARVARVDEECSKIALGLVRADICSAAAVACAGRAESGFRFASAAAGASRDTPFDLASVTKPIVAATAARLAQRGGPALETKLEALLEEARATPAGAASIELLLAHRAGLEAHRELFAPLRARRAFRRDLALRNAATAFRAECKGPIPEAGFPTLYSDLGYLLVGAALERATSRALDELIDGEVAQPLGLDIMSARRWRMRGRSILASVPPTEHVSWRGGDVRGIVHDENAWAIAGHGAAGHAGLFGTAEAVARFGAAVLDALAGRNEGWLSSRAIARLVRKRPGTSLRAGFDGKSSAESSAGARAGPATFGHLGFTGTSLWCDPDASAVVVVLTNRTYPSRANVAIRRARPGVHDALFALAEELAQ